MKTKSVRSWLPDDNIMIITLGIVITIKVVTNIITKIIITVTIIIIIIIPVLAMIFNNNIMDCKNGVKGKNCTGIEKCAVWNG